MIVIIGAGISGLTCAKYLKDKGIEALILEASDAVGGRVRTDLIDGFQFDRGFQVLLTSYPEARKLLNFNTLNLKKLPSGARIRTGNRFFIMPNPLKNWLTAPLALTAPVGSFKDKFKILRLNQATKNATEPDLSNAKNQTTRDFLHDFGFSEKMVNTFFRPFFRGVFLEKNLDTDASFFQFLFRMFAQGDVVVPEKGMQAIPEQIAAHLIPHQIRLNSAVEKIEGRNVFLKNGEKIEAEKIVLATDARTTARLLHQSESVEWNSTDCLYFEAIGSTPSVSGTNLLAQTPYLMLNANTDELIDNLTVLSSVAPSYAATGKMLISVSVVGKNSLSETALVEKVAEELTVWFGQNHTFNHLKTYRIAEALPQYFAQKNTANPLKINDFTFVCGDHTAYPSLNAAMRTGREIAEMLS